MPPVPVTGATAPLVKCSFMNSSSKGEDANIVKMDLDFPEPRNEAEKETFGYDKDVLPKKWHLFCVFDGHNGNKASYFLADRLGPRLQKHMPGGVPPPRGTAEAANYLRDIRRAICEALEELEVEFAEFAERSGSTVTICVVMGWLVTVANAGDSTCLVDTGFAIEQLSVDHRVGGNADERARLQAAGGMLAKLDVHGLGPNFEGGLDAGYGPVRVWPGGLALSRSFGDFDVGEFIICSPYIQQLVLPSTGARLVLCSDGIWDSFPTYRQAVYFTREFTHASAAQRLNKKAIAMRGLLDDNTAIVVDVLPGHETWPQICGLVKVTGFAKLCMCGKAVYDEGASMAHSTMAKGEYLHSVDTAPGLAESSGKAPTEAWGASSEATQRAAQPDAAPEDDVAVAYHKAMELRDDETEGESSLGGEKSGAIARPQGDPTVRAGNVFADPSVRGGALFSGSSEASDKRDSGEEAAAHDAEGGSRRAFSPELPRLDEDQATGPTQEAARHKITHFEREQRAARAAVKALKSKVPSKRTRIARTSMGHPTEVHEVEVPRPTADAGPRVSLQGVAAKPIKSMTSPVSEGLPARTAPKKASTMTKFSSVGATVDKDAELSVHAIELPNTVDEERLTEEGMIADSNGH